MKIIYRIHDMDFDIFLNNRQSIKRDFHPKRICNSKRRCFYLGDKLHRIGGPAVEIMYFDQRDNWYFIHGIEYSVKDYWNKVNAINLQD